MWTPAIRRAARVACVAAGILAGAPGQAAEAAPMAAWKAKELKFAYMGFTTNYSCEGLGRKVRDILLALGARSKDLVVTPTGCEPGVGQPARLPGVFVRMNVLEPVAESSAQAGSSPVAAQWKPVDVKLDISPLGESGQCELVDEIKHQILPLFTTRNVEFKPNCVPHKLSPRPTHLSAEVLAAAEEQGTAGSDKH
jgi:hypothetical protein